MFHFYSLSLSRLRLQTSLGTTATILYVVNITATEYRHAGYKCMDSVCSCAYWSMHPKKIGLFEGCIISSGLGLVYWP